ncbi:MAG: UDP-glucose 4-epimerase [Candidatus Omnitrophota bacterium]|jgi:UDP-glucose 4-epimerase
MQIKNKKFIVTGGAGFIGSHVIEQLLIKDPAKVIIIDNLERGKLDNLAHLDQDKLQFVQADINDREQIENLFEDIDGCFHLAGLRITQCASEPQKAFHSMVSGAFNVIDLCRQKKVGKVIFSSTASVYGLADSFPTNESHHPWNNNTLYGATKVFGEGVLRAFADTDDLNYIALRYFNVYGPRMDAYGKYTEVMIRWMECFENNQSPKIFGDGQQTMDFVYVGDVARANILAMESELADAVYNVASGTETSLTDVLNELAQAYKGSHLKPEYLEERKVNPVPRRLADTARAEKDIGFVTKVDFKEGIQKLVDWYRSLTISQ